MCSEIQSLSVTFEMRDKGLVFYLNICGAGFQSLKWLYIKQYVAAN